MFTRSDTFFEQECSQNIGRLTESGLKIVEFVYAKRLILEQWCSENMIHLTEYCFKMLGFVFTRSEKIHEY